MHPEMPITLVLPSNQELWKLKPNGDIAHVMTHNNTKIAEIVGLTSEKEFREYFGNDMRITRTKGIVNACTCVRSLWYL